MVKSVPVGSVGGVFDHIVGDGLAAVVGCGPVECGLGVAACGGEVCWCTWSAYWGGLYWFRPRTSSFNRR